MTGLLKVVDVVEHLDLLVGEFYLRIEKAVSKKVLFFHSRTSNLWVFDHHVVHARRGTLWKTGYENTRQTEQSVFVRTLLEKLGSVGAHDRVAVIGKESSRHLIGKRLALRWDNLGCVCQIQRVHNLPSPICWRRYREPHNLVGPLFSVRLHGIWHATTIFGKVLVQSRGKTGYAREPARVVKLGVVVLGYVGVEGF